MSGSGGKKTSDSCGAGGPFTRPRRSGFFFPRTRRVFLRLIFLFGLAGAGSVVLFVGVAWIFPFPEELLDSIPASQVVLSREGEILRVYANRNGDFMIPVELKKISPHVVTATCAIEDRRFWSHPGVDPLAVIRALWQDVISGHIVSGASTITMQVVRLLEGRPRTLRAKIMEAFRALQLERRLTKKEILALYLTLAPYGGNLYGIEAASLAYLGKRSSELSLPEAALLAGLPQSPARLRPDRFPRAALKRRNLVIKALVRDGVLSEREAERYSFDPSEAEKKGICLEGEYNPYRRRPFPFRAPHFCRFVQAREPERALIRSTLDLALQQKVERLLRRKIDELTGVTNASCIVVENTTGEVLAYVGSLDFWSVENSGQVDGLRAFRSPGSTLKPFLYALAYDKGVLAPEEVLPDLPLLASSWEPDNYDRSSHGLVPAQEALARSYNLTAVRLLARYGGQRFLDFLVRSGVVRRPPRKPGLSVILGAVEVRPVDLVRAYTALGRFGHPTSLRFTTGEIVENPMTFVLRDRERERALGEPVRVGVEESERFSFSREACYLTAQALTRTGSGEWSPVGVAWKTGTSWGRRDAWTVAYTPRYTIGVWAGNFSGESSPVLVGANAAAPCALEIASFVDPRPSWPKRPEGILEGKVCAETGLRAGPFCPHVVSGRVLKNDFRRCRVHRRFPVDSESGRLLCRSCLGERKVTWKVFSVWPPDIEYYLELHGKKPLPPHLSSCPVAGTGRGPRILSPAPGKKYFTEDRLLPVKVFSPSRELYFFLDGIMIGKKSCRFSLPVEPGRHSLACVDGDGRSSFVTFECVAD